MMFKDVSNGNELSLSQLIGGATPNTYWETEEQVNESSTTGTAWTTKIVLTTDSENPAGKYRIGSYCEHSFDSLKDQWEGRIIIDDTTVLRYKQKEPKDIVEWDAWATVGYIDLTAGSHTIKMQYRSSRAGKTAKIRNATIETWIKEATP